MRFADLLSMLALGRALTPSAVWAQRLPVPLLRIDMSADANLAFTLEAAFLDPSV